jgi:hypothetical protein
MMTMCRTLHFRRWILLDIAMGSDGMYRQPLHNDSWPGICCPFRTPYIAAGEENFWQLEHERQVIEEILGD